MLGKHLWRWCHSGFFTLLEGFVFNFHHGFQQPVELGAGGSREDRASGQGQSCCGWRKGLNAAPRGRKLWGRSRGGSEPRGAGGSVSPVPG